MRANRTVACTLLAAFVCASCPGASSTNATPPRAKPKAAVAARPEPAQAAQPYISSIFPPGGQQGQTVKVTVEGRDLGNVREVFVTGTGVTARLSGANTTNRLEITVTLAAGAPLGERDLRVLTRGGPSNRFRFIVGELPETLEQEPNSELRQAQALNRLPVVVNGRLLQADRDFYKFHGKAGQTLVLDVQARALLPYIADAVPGWCDPVMTLYSPEGKPLITVDDFRSKPDPVITCTLPTTGDYYVELNDVLFRGRADFVYRLTIGEIPYVTDIYPLGGQRGTTARVLVRGVNLPLTNLDVAIPADSPKYRSIGLSSGGLAHNRLPFAVGNWAEATETEPNDSLTNATVIAAPATVNGIIDHPGDIDYYKFKAQRGDRWVMEIIARRVDSPLDSVLTLLDSTGKELQENDDTPDPEAALVTHQADSRIVYTFRQNADFYLRVRDGQSKGGPAYAYRLSIGPEPPDFTLRLTPDNPRVGRGETALITIDAVRKGGFDGDISVVAENLPAKFNVNAAVLTEGQNQGVLTITAPFDAELGILEPKISGKAKIEEKEVVHAAFPAESVMQAFAYTYYVPTHELLLGVVEGAPFALAINVASNAVLELPRSGELQLPVKVLRREGGNGAVSINLVRPPPGVAAKAVLVAADAEAGNLILTATPKAALGPHDLVVQGTLRGKNLNVIAPAISVKVIDAAKPAPTQASAK
jgi:hypothetical protein